jgi:hypothetical protein
MELKPLRPLRPPHPLKPFRSFLPDRSRRLRRKKPLGEAYQEEATEGNITDAVALVLVSTLTKEEREEALRGFIKELSAMPGDQIVAIAVASD